MAEDASYETHYELHELRDNRWLIERVLTQRDAAFLAARELAALADTRGVRVVKECYRPASAQSTAVTLYEYVRPGRPHRPPALQPTPTPRPLVLPVLANEQPAPASGRSWRELAPAASILVAAALATTVGLLLMFTRVG